MLETYGDTIHLNDGTHLTGTVDPEEDAMWQEIYGNTIAGNLPLYDLPNGKEGNRFLDYFAQIIEDMAAGKCNSEKMLCFPALMLIKQFDGRNRNARAVKDLLSQRLDLWDEGRYSALLKSVTDVWNRGNGTGSGVRRNENNKDTSVAKKYDAMVKDGKLRNAMRMVEQTSGGGGGGKLYRYDDKDTKSGDPVIDVTSFAANFPILSSRTRVTSTRRPRDRRKIRRPSSSLRRTSCCEPRGSRVQRVWTVWTARQLGTGSRHLEIVQNV